VSLPLKVAVLAGGRGWRLGERTERQPKALVEIGGRPILWHVMRICIHHGLDRFVVATGYRGEEIERFLREQPGDGEAERWSVEIVDTGLDTATGGRLGRLRERLDGDRFVLAWCDGLADLDLGALLEFHRSHGRLATLAAVHPRSRFGELELAGDRVSRFAEKPVRRDDWVSGGFFALEPEVLDYVRDDRTDWDREVLVRLSEAGELMAYRHDSFWRCMDTPDDARALEQLWGDGAPWAVWR
jgi:glucose-1-phosphate cytidylyltransferase